MSITVFVSERNGSTGMNLMHITRWNRNCHRYSRVMVHTIGRGMVWGRIFPNPIHPCSHWNVVPTRSSSRCFHR
jgi:hypothetical protein